MICSCHVVLNGTAIQEPSTLVGAINCGLSLQRNSDVNTEATNCRGTLLIGTVSSGAEKSSICSATEYMPDPPPDR